MSRTTARKHAFILIFQIQFYDKFNIDEVIELYLSDIENVDEKDKTFIYTELSGVYQNKDKIDELISDKCQGWTFDRLNNVDIAILRLAVYETIYAEDIPSSVSVNEAIELAKIYGSDDSPSFINGILGKIISSGDDN